MKVAVDGYEIGKYAAGVGRVTQNILTHLSSIFPEAAFVVYTREENDTLAGKNVIPIVLPEEKGYTRWQNGPFFKKLKEMNPDILIASNYTLPWFCRWKSVLILHDVSFASHPEWYSRKEVFMRKLQVKRSLKKADFVITPSEFSKKETLKNFSADPEKITVLYWGVEERFQREDESKIHAWKEKKGFQDKTVIGYLGSLFVRRNIPLLVEAARLLRKEMPEVCLHIIGKDLSYPPQNLGRLLNTEWILWENRIEDKDIPLFYSSLDAFAYLSEYEGFGLPPLEALSCGTLPVLLNQSSIREIYKDMAVMVDKPDPAPVKEALRSAISSSALRREIMDKFREKRSHFSWEKASNEFSLILKALISGEKG